MVAVSAVGVVAGRVDGVDLAGREAVELPRQWDDPGREPDEEPEQQLADFFERISEAMQEWQRSLHLLLPE